MASFWDKIQPSKPEATVVGIEVLQGGRVLQLAWSDGARTGVSARALRLGCPCAGCVDEWTHKPTLDPAKVPEGTTLEEVSPVGNYALGLRFSDNHSTGIFTWKHLRELSAAVASP